MKSQFIILLVLLLAIPSSAFFPKVGSTGINIGSKATDPATGKAGDFYYNSTDDVLKYYDAAHTAWTEVGSGSGGGGNFAEGGNFLTNNSWEVDDSDWTASGGSYSRSTGANNVLTPGVGSGAFDASASGQTLTASASVSGDGLISKTLVFSCETLTTATDYLMEGLVNGVVRGSTTISASTGFKRHYVLIDYGGDGALAATVRFKSQSNANIMRADQCFYGISTNFTPVVYGPAMSDFSEDNTFTVSGMGTISAQHFYTKRVGDTLHVRGIYTTGTVAASTASIDLPSKYALDTAKLDSATNAQKIGNWGILAVSGGPLNATTNSSVNAFLFYDGSTTSKIFFSRQVGTVANQFDKQNGSSICSSNEKQWIEFSVPIAGWGANVLSANSTSFRIADLLASGTRVTGSAPTAVGQYRSYLRNANASTYTETNGSPGTAPSITDGIKLYGGNAYTSADSNNEPSKYEMYIGPNKHFQMRFWSTTGRSGFVNATPMIYSAGGRDLGVVSHYEPNTGILTVVMNRYLGGGETSDCGIDNTSTEIHDCYYDATVSENALPVQQEGLVVTPNTYAEKIIRFTFSTSGGICTGTPCTIDSQTGSAISSVAWTGTGNYTVNFTAGTFSAAPACVWSTALYAARVTWCSAVGLPTTSSFDLLCVDDQGTARNVALSGICMGPK